MAIPDFSGYFGVALMKQDLSTGEWFFVDWANGSADFVVDYVSPGTWAYQLWLVVGSGSDATSVNYDGNIQLAVQNLKR